MAFITKEWKDRIVEYAGRRRLTNVSTQTQEIVDVERAEGTVSQAGDAFSAANMNNLEQRISDEFTAVNDNLNAMVDTRYNPQSAKPEWKEQGADTWHPFSSVPTLLDSGIFTGSGDWINKTISLGDRTADYSTLIFCIMGSNDEAFNYITNLSFTNCAYSDGAYNTGRLSRGMMCTRVLTDLQGAVSCTITSGGASSSRYYGWCLYGI